MHSHSQHDRSWAGSSLEQLERRFLFSAPTIPGTPAITGIAPDGANSVTWAKSAGSGIKYVLQYQEVSPAKSSKWADGGSTEHNALSFQSGHPLSTYYLRIVAEDADGNSVSAPRKFTTAGPLTPSVVEASYGLTDAVQSNGGANQTIGLVEIGSDPSVMSDLAAFDSKFGIAAPPSIEVVNKKGQTSDLPAASTADEESLDVEWAHAIAPKARIIVVDGVAGSDQADHIPSIATCAKEAVRLGATVVSISYQEPQSFFGQNGIGTEQSYDADFSASGVTFIACSGDYFGQAFWPSVSPNVLSVGGVQLAPVGLNPIATQQPWKNPAISTSADGSGTGFGDSNDVSTSLTNGSITVRTTPDVSMASRGFDLFYNTHPLHPEEKSNLIHTDAGGTSVAAPIWAAIVALTNVRRKALGFPNWSSSAVGGSQNQIQTALYAAPATDFGLNSAPAGEEASQGYETETGLGTPTEQLLEDLTSSAENS